uniref:Uncharacterized protein n=1 Tax=Meloidogyne enterolobii TaxID=390850 RepID=A0A6V7VPZ3_MELEN|nr:unnamed protein product [Meloidogyne enterolobii]
MSEEAISLFINSQILLYSQGFDDISKNIKNEDLNNFTGKVCKNIGEQPNNDKEICLSSPNSLNFNCKINFEKLRLGVEYKPSISSIMKNSGKLL